jgi:hypothetical protein
MWTKQMRRYGRTVAEKQERHLGLISNRVEKGQSPGPVGDLAGDKDGTLRMTGWNRQSRF